jgi:predicted metal-dependent hydrolase
MNKDECYGPFTIECRGRPITCFLVFNGIRGIFTRCFYGCLFITLGEYSALHFFKTRSIKDLKNPSFISKERVSQVIGGFLEENQTIEKFSKRGIDLQGELYKTDGYAYILGEKKEVTFDYQASGVGKIYAHDTESLNKLYADLALAYFKKQTDFYRIRMNITAPIIVKTTSAIKYIGLNNTASNVLRFHEAIYAFKPEVGSAIIIHELAHCFQRNHSKSFYDIVLENCPDYYRYERIIASGRFQEK